MILNNLWNLVHIKFNVSHEFRNKTWENAQIQKKCKAKIISPCALEYRGIIHGSIQVMKWSESKHVSKIWNGCKVMIEREVIFSLRHTVKLNLPATAFKFANSVPREFKILHEIFEATCICGCNWIAYIVLHCREFMFSRNTSESEFRYNFLILKLKCFIVNCE